MTMAVIIFIFCSSFVIEKKGSGKLLLIRIVENNEIDDYFREGLGNVSFVPQG